MQKIRAFFYVSLGVLALAGAFHLGVKNAEGQSASEVVRTETSSGERNYLWVITRDGGAYLVAAPFSDGKHEVVILAKGNIHQAPAAKQ